MVIDRTGIKHILRRTESDLLKHQNEDSIYISTKFNDFEPDKQIGNDSIDLRIDDTGYILSDDYEYINTLSDENFDKYFTSVSLNTKDGYTLMPGEILFINTLEQINLKGNIIGRITGRSVFSRFGISVHCTQEKFSSGINSIAALQIRNNSKIPLKIFPYQKLAQLIIEKTERNTNPYHNSTFSHEEKYTLPTIKPSDREQYDDRTKTNILKLKPKKKNIINGKPKQTKKILLSQIAIGAMLTVGLSYACSHANLFVVSLLAIIYISIDILYFWILNE